MNHPKFAQSGCYAYVRIDSEDRHLEKPSAKIIVFIKELLAIYLSKPKF